MEAVFQICIFQMHKKMQKKRKTLIRIHIYMLHRRSWDPTLETVSFLCLSFLLKIGAPLWQRGPILAAGRRMALRKRISACM